MKKLFLLALAFCATPALAAYRCVDEKGITHVGDTPPPGCANVVMYEVTRSGTVIRKIDPTPKELELKLRQEQAARQKEEDKRLAEQKRRDYALLQTFSSEKEFDVVLERNLDPLRGRIKTGQDRIAAVDKRLKAIDDEMEFYVAGKSKAKDGKEPKRQEPPKSLTDEQERLKAERAGIEKSIAGLEKEIEAIRARFGEDKKRWLALKSGTGGSASNKGRN